MREVPQRLGSKPFVRALVVGLLAQVLALACYSWLAIGWPQSPLKYLGFVVLVAGSVWAVWLLRRSSARCALVGMVALAMAAPLVPLLASAKGREMLLTPGDYAPFYLRGFAMAFVCYAAAAALSRAFGPRVRPLLAA